MCLAIPAQISELHEGNMATVDILGVTRDISIDLTPAAKEGDYVLVHAGFAIEVVVQIISGIALIAGLPALDNLFFWANTNLSPAGAIHGFMWGCIGYTAVFTVVLYCLTIRMLHRHLNLE